MSYGWEKLHLAVHSLAGLGSMDERLANAVSYNLIHITPENDLPEEIQEDFREFMSHITSVPQVGDEGSIRATINTFDEAQMTMAVEKIISFYDRSCRYMPQ